MIEFGEGYAAFWLPINPAVIVYLIGVVIGLFVIDARLPARLGLALLWPIGPLAFVITVSILLLALPIAFPIAGTIVLGLLLAAIAFAWKWGTAAGL